jgi:hypothetical protein
MGEHGGVVWAPRGGSARHQLKVNMDQNNKVPVIIIIHLPGEIDPSNTCKAEKGGGER